MARTPVTKLVKETVLDEYNHRCAICGVDRPHLHHIDEDSSNSTVENLIPLCPNCHLTDQHNPTRKLDIPKLNLFRKYKDPAILKPQFDPIYKRMIFLDDVIVNSEKLGDIASSCDELVAFIRMFEMGEFYAVKVKALIDPIFYPFISFGEETTTDRQGRQDCNKESRKKIVNNKNIVFDLIIELLKYQLWAHNQIDNKH